MGPGPALEGCLILPHLRDETSLASLRSWWSEVGQLIQPAGPLEGGGSVLPAVVCCFAWFGATFVLLCPSLQGTMVPALLQVGSLHCAKAAVAHNGAGSEQS
eukprot:6456820-Amphidinium_carterae.2